MYARLNEIKQKREQETKDCNSLEAEFVIAYIILYLDTLFPHGKCITGPADKVKLALSHQNFQTNSNWKIINKTPNNEAHITHLPSQKPQITDIEDTTKKILDLWDTRNHLCTGRHSSFCEDVKLKLFRRPFYR